MEADSLSTALFVRGPQEGVRLLRRRAAAGFVLTRESGARVLTATAGFAAAHGLRAAAEVKAREAP
jgi:thiamine biosynthesis lipoprotein ApbE